jgi:hypothetical protein
MTSIPTSAVRFDGGTQSRVELNEATVAEYAAALVDGAVFPPIIVFFDGEHHWLADGFHRLESHVRVGNTEVDADIRQGTQRDALMFSLAANATHGLPRTNVDKRKAVTIALDDPVWSKLSDREIAKLCGVGHAFVSNMRKEPLSTVDKGARRKARTLLRGHGAEGDIGPESINDKFASNDDESAALEDFIRPRIETASLAALIHVRAFVKRIAESLHGEVLA